MTTVKLNFAVVETYAVQAFKETCLLLGREFTQVISEPGAFEGFAGDIVDTGQLRGSQLLEFITSSEARFSWNVDYAYILHEGADFRAGESWQVEAHQRRITQAFGRAIAPNDVIVNAHSRTRRRDRTLEGRPWTKKAMERFDVGGTFNQLLAEKLK
jgi:hypothetical protein